MAFIQITIEIQFLIHREYIASWYKVNIFMTEQKRSWFRDSREINAPGSLNIVIFNVRVGGS
jgi:hypothetical protein